MIIYLSMFFTKKVLEASNHTIQAYVRIESVHEGNKLFKCNDCGPGFSLKWNMNKYTESVPEEKKPLTTHKKLSIHMTCS